MIKNRETELLVILQEECSEVIQATSKVFRFGKTEGNMQQLHTELGDLLCVLNELIEDGIFDVLKLEKLAESKKTKLKKYMKHRKST